MTKRKSPKQQDFRPVDRPIMVMTQVGFRLPTKVPCIECPLARTSGRGVLGGYTPAQYIEVMYGPADLACHLSKGFDTRDVAAQRSCTGLAMYRRNVRFIPDGKSALAAVLDVETNTDLVFGSPLEFLQHHTTGERNDD